MCCVRMMDIGLTTYIENVDTFETFSNTILTGRCIDLQTQMSTKMDVHKLTKLL